MALLVKTMDWMSRKLFSRKIILTIILVFLLSLFSVIGGISDYKRTQKASNDFKLLNKTIFNLITSYTYYSFQGASIFPMQSSTEIFFPKSGIRSNLLAKVDANWSSNICSNCNSSALFKEEKTTSFNFSNVLLYAGSFILIILGFNVFRDKEKIKKIIGIASSKIVFVYISISIIFFVAIILALLIFLLICTVKLNSIPFGNKEIWGMFAFYKASLIMLISSFFIGAILAHIRKNSNAYTSILIVWFILTFAMNGAVEYMSSKKAISITTHFKRVAQKVNVVYDFETWAKKNYGDFNRNNIDIERKIIEKYWNFYFKEMERIDDEFLKELEGVIHYHNFLSVLSPTSFYNNTCAGISSNGYENLIELNRHLKKTKATFVRFWIDQVYYKDHKILKDFFEVHPEMEIFEAKPVTPSNFMLGEAIGIAWCIVLMAIGYCLFIGRIRHNAGSKESDCENVDVFLIKGGFYGFHCHDRDFSGILLNLFFGMPGKFNGKFVIEDADIVNKKMKNFLYLPSIDQMECEDRAGDYLEYILKLCSLKKNAIKKVKAEFSKDILNQPLPELESIWKLRLLLAVAYHVEREVYILRDIGIGVDINQVEDEDLDRLESILRRDSTVIDLFTDITANTWYTGDEQTKMFVIRYKDGKYKLSVR